MCGCACVRVCVRVCACLCGEGGIEVPVCRREEREREKGGIIRIRMNIMVKMWKRSVVKRHREYR